MGGRGEGGRGREGQERGEGRREGEKRGKRESGEGTGEEGRGEAASAFRICQPGLAPGRCAHRGLKAAQLRGKVELRLDCCPGTGCRQAAHTGRK